MTRNVDQFLPAIGWSVRIRHVRRLNVERCNIHVGQMRGRYREARSVFHLSPCSDDPSC